MPIIKKKASLINTNNNNNKRPLEKPKKVEKTLITNITPKYYYI